MTSNVGLTTPRGSGTSGYVQKNKSQLKPRDPQYGAPPSYSDKGADTFQQRQPDRNILEHDRRREIEVRVLEERDRLEEENERIEEGGEEDADEEDDAGEKSEEGEEDEEDTSSTRRGAKRKEKKKEKLSEEEIEERLDALRSRLTRELEDELAGRPPPPTGPRGKRKQDAGPSERDAGTKPRKQFKAHQVHELAEAKIQESERLRKALGIKNEGEESRRDGGRRPNFGDERYRDRDDPRDRERREEERKR